MKKIALVTGGYTGESVISYKSAAMIFQNLDKDQFDVYKIDISPEKWFYTDIAGKEYLVDKNDFTLTIKNEKIQFDVAFIALHGSPGEDGKLQSIFDLCGIPYTSCNALTSAITMNKHITKKVVDDIGELKLSKSVRLFRNKKPEISQIMNQLSFPMFVKPNSGGSSIGMSKVKVEQELFPAIQKAFLEDEEILIEEFISGREFTVGIYRTNGIIKVLPITEIISSKEFFDFEAKYTPGVSKEITPADLTQEITSKVVKIATEVYEVLNCAGMVRVDFILKQPSDQFYFIEINTIPGQSENSIIPQQVRASGKTMKDFYAEIIWEALNYSTK